MRELELHPPAEDWNRRMPLGVPGSPFLESDDLEDLESYADPSPIELWPRKRRRVEHDAAFGLSTAVGLGSFTTLLGSRRDVITSQWKPPSHGAWHKVRAQLLIFNRCGDIASLEAVLNFLIPITCFMSWHSIWGYAYSYWKMDVVWNSYSNYVIELKEFAILVRNAKLSSQIRIEMRESLLVILISYALLNSIVSVA